MNKKYAESYWGTIRNKEAFFESYFPSDMNAKTHERSKWICKFFKDFEFNSCFEAGVNCGRNIYHLESEFPEVEFAGIDINKEAVDYGKTKVNADLCVGSLSDLNEIVKKKYDLVFTMAVLIHIAPEEIEKVIDNIISITNKTIINFEFTGNNEVISGHKESNPKLRVNDQYLWAHDLCDIYSKKGIAYKKIPMPENILDIGLKDIIICNIA